MEVVCVGILVADMFASPIDSLPQAGELKTMDGLLMGVGGCAANTAACLRKLGRNVTVVGKVGQDMLGDFVLGDLCRLGVETAHVRRSRSYPTAATVIVNVRGEDRRYLHCVGANVDFSLADIDLSVLDGGRALYVGGYLAMPRFDPGQLAELFRRAKQRSLVTVLDVVVPAGVRISLDQLAPVLRHTDFFLPNSNEAEALTGQNDSVEQVRLLSHLNLDCTIVITRGRLGSVTKCGNMVIDTAGFPMESIDESGAGDAFAAGIITGILEGWPLDYTLCFAGAVGASCTRALGCTEGVFRFEEAVAFLAKHQAEAPSATSL